VLIDEPTLRKLNRLTLIASRVRAGAMKGERRSTRRGSGVEFADYRDYSHGDDLRRLDWNVYARLDRPFVKLREEEEDLAVHVLLDASQSMRWGEDQHDKFDFARRLAAAIGAIALAAGDRLSVALLQASDRYETSEISVRGQQHLPRLLKFLEAQHPGGATDLNAS